MKSIESREIFEISFLNCKKKIIMPLYQYNVILLINITISLFRDFLHCTNQIDQEDSENLCRETVLYILRALGQQD